MWIVREGYIGDAFFDKDAGNFLLKDLARQREGHRTVTPNSVTLVESQGALDSSSGNSCSPSIEDVYSPAVGPAWTNGLPYGLGNGRLKVEFNHEVVCISESQAFERGYGHLAVTLDDGRILYSDIVVSAIGVDPAVEWAPVQLVRATDGGILVNSSMETSVPDVYAAGDACTIRVDGNQSTHWFQMRLWSQARAQGIYAAHCMCGMKDEFGSDMAFEIFTHVTRFLGKKVSQISATCPQNDVSVRFSRSLAGHSCGIV